MCCMLRSGLPHSCCLLCSRNSGAIPGRAAAAAACSADRHILLLWHYHASNTPREARPPMLHGLMLM